MLRYLQVGLIALKATEAIKIRTEHPNQELLEEAIDQIDSAQDLELF